MTSAELNLNTLEDFYNLLETKVMKDFNYTIADPWEHVEQFEKRVAEYSGAAYAVSTDTCTNSMYMCLKYIGKEGTTVTIPDNTYLSVPQAIIHAGYVPKFVDKEWNGMYCLEPFNIIDCATRFKRDMYVPGSFQCLSFHKKKILNLGKGGMILTDNKEAAEWFKKMRYEGRDLTVLYSEDNIKMNGWNFYMSPETAMMGLLKFKEIMNRDNPDSGGSWRYKKLTTHDLFKEFAITK